MRNFFEHQAAARRRSGWLVAYFALAVVATIALAYFLVAAIFAYPEAKAGQQPTIWHPVLLVAVTVLVSMLIGGCSLYKIAELSSGGKAVALMMGGQELVGPTRDLRERRLLNVVEEMAIASGIPVPPVYVLTEEEGINAFAAGYSPGEGIVAVSRGCIECLNRDELQGVIAHEFSHILNGDMRLNIRLMALIFGIMGLATVGAILLRSQNRTSSRKSKGAGQILLLGVGLYVLGIAGAFFGNLIKAAVSRQREFLADASAVQFTRNPDGIGGALIKIGGIERKSNIGSPHAAEASHMFFADALLSSRLIGFFATHPPLEDRIRRVLPNWDGTYPKVKQVSAEEEPSKPARKPFGAMPTLPGMPQAPIPVLAAVDETVEQVGTVSPGQTAYASDLIASFPPIVEEATRDPFSARALVYCLLLDSKPEIREAQLSKLRDEAEPRDLAASLRLMESVAALPPESRLPLIDLSMPALKRMSAGQYQTFRRQIENLTAADQRLSLFEYVLRCVLEQHLDREFNHRVVSNARPSGRESTGSVVAVLSHLAQAGHSDMTAARRAFDAGVRRFFSTQNPPTFAPADSPTLSHFDQHLRQLAATSAETKKRVMIACATCIAADRKVTVEEAELFRAIGDVLGCPVPTPAIE